jgi:hypothetical protein
MDFYAYYPYNESVEDPAAIALDLASQKDNMKDADVLRAANTTGLFTGEVTLSFDHVLAMLRVQADELTNEEDVVKVLGVNTSVALNLGTGEVTASEDAATGVLTLSASGNGLFEAFLPAKTYSGELHCEHDGATYVYTFTDLALEAAKIKQINLSIK